MSWQSDMANENQRFRDLWAEHGPDYLYGDWIPLPPPMIDGSLTMDSVDRRIDDMFTKFSAGELVGSRVDHGAGEQISPDAGRGLR
jgi:hypothetical protein